MIAYSKSEYEKYLNILEVNATDSLDTIKSAYRKLVAKYHPDKQADEIAKELTNEKLTLINEAYEYTCKYYDNYTNNQSNYFESYKCEVPYRDNLKDENCSDKFYQHSNESVLLEQNNSQSRKKIVQIVIAVILCISIIIVLSVAIIGNRNEPTSEYRNINRKDIISLISEENKLEKTLKESRNDIVFINFLNTLNTFLIGDFEYLTIDKLKCKKFCTINGFKLHKNNFGYTLIDPKISSIYMISHMNGSEDGYLWFKINFEYLKKKYSLYLSNEMNEYLDIRIKQNNDLGSSSLLYDSSLTVGEDVVLKWILDLQKFMEKYPNFALNKNIKDRVNLYSSYILLNASTFDRQTKSVDKKRQKVYQDYINKVNKEIEAYDYVLKAFNILQKNDFKDCSTDFQLLFLEFRAKYLPELNVHNDL